MSMSRLVAAMGAAAGGVSRGMDEFEAQKRRKTRDDRDEAEYQYRKGERDRATGIRDDLGAAGAAVVPDDSPVAPPIGSADAPRAPEDQGTRVAGKTYTDPAQAQAALEQANSPMARATRMADVLMRNGEHGQAQQMRTGAMQERQALVQTQQAEVEAKNRGVMQEIVGALATGGVEAIPSIYAKYNDGYTATVAPGEKGGFSVTRIGADGKPSGTKSFADMNEFIGSQVARMDPSLYMRDQQHRGDQARVQANSDRDFSLRETDQKDNKEYRGGMLKVAQDKNANAIELAGLKASTANTIASMRLEAAKGGGGMQMSDLKDGHKGIASTLNADYKTQIDMTQDPAELKAIKVARDGEVASTQRLYTGAMQSGFALTPEQAIIAFRSGKPAIQPFKGRDGAPVNVEGVLYDGRFIPMAEKAGTQPGQDASKPSSPASPAAAKPAKANGAPPEQPTKTAFEGSFAKAMGAMQTRNESDGRESEAIRARVREADGGGTPLTAAERATARKYSIAPIKG
jgi:hypothetical protein